MKYKLFYVLLFSLFSIKNGANLNNLEINISYILSYKFIFIHHSLNNNSLNIQKSLKEISPNNLTTIDIIRISNPIKFLKSISDYIKVNKTISIPLLLKNDNNCFQVYNNNHNVKALKKFLNENKAINGNKVIYSKISFEFLNNIIFNQKNCLIIFYIKNYKSKQIMKKIIPKIEQKINTSVAFTDMTNKFSYKLFDVLEGYENNLPCLRYIKFKNNKLFYTKKEKIDLLDLNIINIISHFVNDSIDNKLFYNIYNSAIFKKSINYFSHINNNYEKKKNLIEI